ncbi:unnamed protein product [Litomosoides sigmodontis]|uniref:IMS import disulfide relay-system CHCH-CHCH-like Cx9C domain-containing protein n=1 Tax=Litomosoides sigmodontis TaxID=42156 RepID=A0A3P6SG80_LITSI|nr:unnamed protein product [Litomosoides sigmodontis]
MPVLLEYCIKVIPVVDMPNERKLYKYATYLSNCSREALNYGKCVGEKAGKVTHLACEREFVSLLNCVEKQIRLLSSTK